MESYIVVYSCFNIFRQFNVYQSAEYGNCWTINSTKHKLVVRDAGPSGGKNNFKIVTWK